MSEPTAARELLTSAGADIQAARAASFGPLFSDLRNTIRRSSPEDIAQRSGAIWDERAGHLSLHLLDVPFRVTWPHLVAYRAGSNTPCSSHFLGILLHYLSLVDSGPRPRADGERGERAGRWISFGELPDGWLYQAAFHGYTGKILAAHLNNDASALARAAEAAGGARLDMGDAGFEFAVLPRVHLAVVYWVGDDEFDAEARVLFDAAASHYMTTDGLAVLGSHLVHRLLEQL